MESLLFQVVSAIVAALVFVVWVRPQTFRVLLDKENNDYPSLGRQGQFTAMIVSSWLIVYTGLKDVVTEWMFGGYMLAWAGAQFGSLWLKLKGQAPGSVTSFESTKSKTVIPEITPAEKKGKK